MSIIVHFSDKSKLSAKKSLESIRVNSRPSVKTPSLNLCAVDCLGAVQKTQLLKALVMPIRKRTWRPG